MEPQNREGKLGALVLFGSSYKAQVVEAIEPRKGDKTPLGKPGGWHMRGRDLREHDRMGLAVQSGAVLPHQQQKNLIRVLPPP